MAEVSNNGQTMGMKNSYLLTALSLMTLFFVTPVHAATLQVTVKDEVGVMVDDAHIYLYEGTHGEYYSARTVQGQAIVRAPAGTYKVYAAILRNNDGYIDHYASVEVEVRLSAGKPVWLLLPMYQSRASGNMISEAVRHKIGIDDDLAPYLN